MNIVSFVPISEEKKKRIYEETQEEVIVTEKGCFNNFDCDVLIARDRDVDCKVIEQCKKLQFIFIVSNGVDKLPFEYLRKKNILVANTVGISDESISNYVMGVILYFSSRLFESLEAQRNNEWIRNLCTEDLNQKRLIVFGAGRIGRAIAQKAKIFGMYTIGVKTRVEQAPWFDKICTITSVQDELHKADYIISCLPLTEKTKYFFAEDVFGQFNPQAIFVNISRGGVVDEAALKNAIENKQIKAAVLDVFETEPLSKDSILWAKKNIIITPHISGRLNNFLDYAMERFIDNLKEFKTEGTLLDMVDLEREY